MQGFIRQVQGLRLEFPIAPGISIIRNSDLLHMQDDDGDDGDEPYSGGAGSSDDGNAGGDSDGSSRGSSSSSTGSASRGFGDALGGLLTPPEGEAPGWGAEDGGGYNCQISLGSGPSDWTLRIRVQPDPPGSGGEGAAAPSGRSIVEHLERCLKGGVWMPWVLLWCQRLRLSHCCYGRSSEAGPGVDHLKLAATCPVECHPVGLLICSSTEWLAACSAHCLTASLMSPLCSMGPCRGHCPRQGRGRRSGVVAGSGLGGGRAGGTATDERRPRQQRRQQQCQGY